MSAALLPALLVIATGYCVSGFLPLRYRMARHSGHLQYGAIILYGLVWLAGAAVLLFGLGSLSPRIIHLAGLDGNTANLGAFISRNVIGISVIGLLASLAMPRLFNRWYYDKRDEQIIHDIHREYRDELDMSLSASVNHWDLLLFVLDTGKVYLGWVVNMPNPLTDREHQYVRILPLRSGYRDAEHRVVFNTDYEPVYAEEGYLKTDAGEKPEGIEDFEKVIPRQAIKSANIFDLEINEKYGLF